jgi:metacaspase-1
MLLLACLSRYFACSIWPRARLSFEEKIMPKKLALCIGINDYPGTSSDLSGCVNDANDWMAALKKRGFTVSQLLDKAATGKAMRAAMAGVVGKAKKGDVVVIQFSGHGSYVPDEDGDEVDGTDECLCPYDIYSKGPIIDDELAEIYSTRAAGVKVVMLSDSCHSGTVSRFAPIVTPPTIKGGSAPARKVRFLPPATFLSAAATRKLGIRSRRPASPPGSHHSLLISGCLDTEYSYDAWFNGRPNGAFSFVALQALAKLPASAKYKDWHKAIRKMLPSQQYPQSPNLYGTSSMKSWKVFG